MNLLSYWPWALGLLGVLAVVGIVLSPVTALQLARSVGGFLLERFRALVEWLRKPRPPGWWSRAFAAVMGVVCLGFAFVAVDAKREVLVVTERCHAQVATIESKARTATSVAQENRRALNTCQLQLKTEVGKRQEVEQLGDQAVQAARRDAAAARKDLGTWQRQYSKRPPTCESALQALETACPTISDY